MKISFVLFNEHLVFHKNWGQYNPYVKAILPNFQALRYALDVDDYHKKFPLFQTQKTDGILGFILAANTFMHTSSG